MNPFAASTSSDPHFRFLGVPVQVQGSFLLVMALLGFTSSREPWQILSWVAVAFVCVLVHELGHALTARAFGHGARIELHGMGGSAHHHGPALSTSRKVLVSLAGPFAGFALGAVVWLMPVVLALLGVLPDGGLGGAGFGGRVFDTVVGDVLWITLGYGALNLLPIVPLDGGHVVQALLVHRWPRRGAVYADVISLVVGVVVLAAALWLRSFGLGFLVLWLLIARGEQLKEAWQQLRARR